MKDVHVIGPTYTADVSGVCSALYEMGGMVVIHDPSGCNSTYNTHDEPRWYDQESLIFISGLSQMDALMGNDEKLIRDICKAARFYQPSFVALVRSPIPLMTGMDFEAAARMIEEQIHIPVYVFPTTGMRSYVSGAAMAFQMMAEKMVSEKPVKDEGKPSVNLLGATPLDLSIGTTLDSIQKSLKLYGFEINATFAMGSTPGEIAEASQASINLALSGTGLPAARVLKERLGIPCVVGFPLEEMQEMWRKKLLLAAGTKEDQVLWEENNGGDADGYIIGEAVFSLSLREMIWQKFHKNFAVICPLVEEKEFGILGCLYLRDEEEIRKKLKTADYVIADPLYEPFAAEKTCFIRLPHEACSGRCFRKELGDLYQTGSMLGKYL